MIDRRGLILSLLAATLAPAPIALAQEADLHKAVIRAFYDSLIAVMKEGPALGFDGRFDRLAPAIRAAFDVAGMAERAIGASWDKLDADQRAGAIAEFERFMIANYASRFKSFQGQVFEVLEVRESAGKPVVLTRLTRADGEPVRLSYLLREIDGAWRIADVYYNGTISEVARLRADFSSTLVSGGIDSLNAALEDKIRQMREGA